MFQSAVLSCAWLIGIVVLMAGSIPAFVGEKGRRVCKTKILVK